MLHFGAHSASPSPLPLRSLTPAASPATEGVEDTPMPPRDAALAATPAMAPEEAYTRRAEGAGLSVAAASAPTRSPRQEPKTGTGRPGPFTREIKIWDPSMLPLGATTHNQDTYKAYKIAPAPSSAAQATYMPSPHKCDGTTTSAEAYRAWPLERPVPPPVA